MQRAKGAIVEYQWSTSPDPCASSGTYPDHPIVELTQSKEFPKLTMTLVLAGGGPGAMAWELGVLLGLAEADTELAQKVIGADTVIGTSGGSSVAVQITSGTPLEELYDAQLSVDTAEIDVEFDLIEFVNRFDAAIEGSVDEMDRRRRVGAFALAASTVSERRRRAVIAAQCQSPPGLGETCGSPPSTQVLTGEIVIFTRDIGVRLVDAVAASCAVPGIWPPASIGGTATSTAASAPARTPTWQPVPIRSSSSPPPWLMRLLRVWGAICQPNWRH